MRVSWSTRRTSPDCVVKGCGRARYRHGWCIVHWGKVRAQSPTASTLTEDAAWLAGTDTAESIAHRLGYRSWLCLRQRLHQIGEPLLADAIWYQIELPRYIDAAGNCHAEWHERREEAVAA
ncbi:hypothetical protein GCM10009785_00160 [Brooklawnia cerclae]|uniref:Uncharacterized protein n=1 Tax=Brooklawnia cerclae TaxID=349934 RepID=A0ABX0SJC3_9ACTN|nr:hypothetical protein [Brooklawnia cerclae]NIH58497.1 hypothetical protein [Brooklawnia cerclae]